MRLAEKSFLVFENLRKIYSYNNITFSSRKIGEF